MKVFLNWQIRIRRWKLEPNFPADLCAHVVLLLLPVGLCSDIISPATQLSFPSDAAVGVYSQVPAERINKRAISGRGPTGAQVGPRSKSHCLSLEAGAARWRAGVPPEAHIRTPAQQHQQLPLPKTDAPPTLGGSAHTQREQYDS